MRLRFVIAAIAVITVTLIPFQWLAVRFALPARRRIPVLYHRMICALIGVRVHVAGKRSEEQPLMIVSNHVSWLDISVVTSIAPVVFIAKHEVASWPLFGLLAKLQRSVFVNRAQRHKTTDVNAEIARRLASGDPVVLFGEGTSSDGNRVLEFRSALVGAARDALAQAEHSGRIWIQPLSIAYTALLGLPTWPSASPARRLVWRFRLAPHFAGSSAAAASMSLSRGENRFHSTKPRIARPSRARSKPQVRRMTSLALRGRPAA